MSDQRELDPPTARCPGPDWDDIIAADSRPTPDLLSEDVYEYMGAEPIDASRYTSAEFFQAEIDKMWPNVWQFAAREEEIPDPGDVAVYDNAGRSYLIVRQADGSVKAFHNTCLHRGRQLRTESGYAKQFKCPYHGFTWAIDGGFKGMPCRWDFPHLTDEALQLPEAAVGRFAGFIFVRDAEDGISFEEFLGPMPAFFDRWAVEDCVATVWVGKVIKANWKVVAEAFMEAWHSLETHPQILPFSGDCNSRYNVYGDHLSLSLTPFGVLSPHVDPAGKSEQWIADAFTKFVRSADAPEFKIEVPEGVTARRFLADVTRHRFAEAFDLDLENVSDAELVDAVHFHLFPNFGPWGGFMPNVVYRWRPWGDQESTLMEVMVLNRTPKGQPKGRGAPMHFLTDDEPWTAATELGPQAIVFEQDMLNLPYIQKGLKGSKNGKVNLSLYQEIKIRQFHRTLDKYLAR